MKATLIPCNADGFAPVTKPGEVCRDRHHGVWHCCAPDGGRFASGGDGSETNMRQLNGLLEFVPHAPTYYFHQHARLPNPWTLHAGEWVQHMEPAN